MKSKLRKEKVRVVAVWFVISAILVLALSIAEDELLNTRYVSWFYGILFLGFGYWFYRVIYMPHRFSRILIFLLYVLTGIAAWHYELAEHYDTFLSSTTYQVHIAVILVIAGLLVPYMMVNKSRMKTRYRKLFELAARPVDDLRSGYSTRPFPVGRKEYSRQEIVSLGKFLERHLIAVPHEYDDRVLMSFSTSARIQKPDPDHCSYISFEDNGSIRVIIRREDYEQYKGAFSFEELCRSMSDLFTGFLENYRQGREDEILRNMDAMESPYLKILLLAGSVLLLAAVAVTFFLWIKNA